MLLVLLVEQPLSPDRYLDSIVEGLLTVKQLLSRSNLHLESPVISMAMAMLNIQPMTENQGANMAFYT